MTMTRHPPQGTRNWRLHTPTPPEIEPDPTAPPSDDPDAPAVPEREPGGTPPPAGDPPPEAPPTRMRIRAARAAC
jgi:hypothetical protein